MVRRKIQFLAAVFSLALPLAVFAQGTSFINLNFEAAILPSLPPGQSGGSILVTSALPGWHAYFGTDEIFTVTHNDVSLGAVNVSMLGPQYASSQILEGAFTVVLQGGFNTGGTSASIAQTGLVPLNARSLQFRIAGQGVADFGVFLGGQSLSLVQMSTLPNYSVYCADITAFAGLPSELRFTSFRRLGGPTGYAPLDAIVFSPDIIPEPSAFGLFGLGALLFTCRSRGVQIEK